MEHATHPEIVRRLKQAHGQLTAILKMFDEGRSCLELAQQIQAVESVVHSAKRSLIQDHMEHCLGDAAAREEISAKEALREFKALSNYL